MTVILGPFTAAIATLSVLTPDFSMACFTASPHRGCQDLVRCSGIVTAHKAAKQEWIKAGQLTNTRTQQQPATSLLGREERRHCADVGLALLGNQPSAGGNQAQAIIQRQHLSPKGNAGDGQASWIRFSVFCLQQRDSSYHGSGILSHTMAQHLRL